MDPCDEDEDEDDFFAVFLDGFGKKKLRKAGCTYVFAFFFFAAGAGFFFALPAPRS